jgi:hypothetical protein
MATKLISAQTFLLIKDSSNPEQPELTFKEFEMPKVPKIGDA